MIYCVCYLFFGLTNTERILFKGKQTCVEVYIIRIGAGNETRTRDPDLGKVVLYQLSYSRLHIDAWYFWRSTFGMPYC